MRYISRMVKVAALTTGAFLTTVIGSATAFADHGSAWSMRQSGAVFHGSGASAGGVQWLVLAILAAALVWAAARIVRAPRGGGDGSKGSKTPVDRERKPVMSVFGPKVASKQPVTANRFQVLGS